MVVTGCDHPRIILHAGDCAETFESCYRDRILRDVNFLLSMGVIINSPLVIGRICGQFGKPRSNHVEIHPDSGEIPVFRGDIINGHTDRQHEPKRMIEAHALSKSMYTHLMDTTSNHRSFPKIFTSHECLLLSYESRLVRQRGEYAYCTSAHFLWIGDRTRSIDGAHVEFCRGIRNPIGLKVSATADPNEIAEIVVRLNPHKIPGKISIITRFGAGKNGLGYLFSALANAGYAHLVLWQCDPMHGNTIQVGRYKTRRIDDIKQEIHETVLSHRKNGTRLHGIHLETTGADVTECIGSGVTVDDLGDRYETACDPRLNPKQTCAVLQYLNQLIDDQNLDFSKTCVMTSPSRQTTCATHVANVSTDEENIV